MSTNKRCLNIYGLFASLALLTPLTQTNAQILFDFNNGTEFSGGQGIGATMTATAGDGSSATATIVDVFALEFVGTTPTATVLSASSGAGVTTEIGTSNSLGVNNPSVSDDDFFAGAGVEERDFNDGEGLVIEFDVPVIFTELDFSSLDVGTVTVAVEGIGSFDFVEDAVNAPGDVFSLPFGTGFIPAGADVTISFSSPTATDANVRIADFTVSTSSDVVTQPVFDFNNETEFDNGQGIGATMTATSGDGNSSATLSILDLFAPEFTGTTPTTNILTASAGDLVTTQIGADSLGIDNPSVTDDDFFLGAGIENRDFNDGEGLVVEFDVPVVVTSLGLVSLDDGTLTIAIEGVGSFTFVNDDVNNPTDDFSLPFGVDFIPAGADITISFSSPTVTDASVRIAEIRVSTSAVSLPGDFNEDGMVNCDDLDGYVGNIGAAATGPLATLDIDGDGTLSAADANTHITSLVVTSNGVTGTFPGDLNCDGTVNVLGDAFSLVANLNNTVTMYSQGDINFDGTVNVLGDAFALVGNLGNSN